MRVFCVFFCFFRAKIWPAAAGTGELARDLRDQTPGRTRRTKTETVAGNAYYSSKGPFKWEGGTTPTYVANVKSQRGRATSPPPTPDVGTFGADVGPPPPPDVGTLGAHVGGGGGR